MALSEAVMRRRRRRSGSPNLAMIAAKAACSCPDRGIAARRYVGRSREGRDMADWNSGRKATPTVGWAHEDGLWRRF